jgi:sugar O-acyltransferase (sialic acid O-acetyltransferase NeuD family)
VICVGNPRAYRARARLVERLALPESRYATVIHPSAQIAESCTVGPGSVILALATLTAAVEVGAHVAVMPQVVLTHDVVVADYATLASGVVLGGGTRIERGAYLGAGALIREQVVVGAWAQVGMGSVVLRDVPAAEVWVGSPARYLRPAEAEALRERRTPVSPEETAVKQNSQIPLVDLGAAHAEIADEVRAGFERVFATTGFVGGPEVAAFEQEYAAYSGVRHCVGVGNGTDALELALLASGVGREDEVVLPANTFIATAEAVARVGARPVLVDCDPDTHLIDVDAALAAVGPRTAAVMPVHLYGQHAAVELLEAKLADSGGPDRRGRGAVPGREPERARRGRRHRAAARGRGDELLSRQEPRRVRRRRRGADRRRRARRKCQGPVEPRRARQVPPRPGRLQQPPRRAAGRGAAGQAAPAARLERRPAAAAARYDALLAGVDGVARPLADPGNVHVWHLYVVRLDVFEGDASRRDALIGKLAAEGIATGIHYPAPVHRTPAFSHLGYPQGAFPNAEAACARILSLPLHPHLTAADQERVVSALAAALR